MLASNSSLDDDDLELVILRLVPLEYVILDMLQHNDPTHWTLETRDLQCNTKCLNI